MMTCYFVSRKILSAHFIQIKNIYLLKKKDSTLFFFKFREKSSSFLDDGLCIILAGENLDDDGPLAERGRGFREVLFKI